MSNLKKTLDSNAVLEVTLAPFAIGHKLWKAVAKEVETVDVSLGSKVASLQSVFDAEVTDQMLNTIKNIISRVLSSEKIEEVLWQCMERATYNGVKITQDTFEDVKARGDYLIVAKEVLWFNLVPFVRNLGSLFQELKAKNISTQKSA